MNSSIICPDDEGEFPNEKFDGLSIPRSAYEVDQLEKCPTSSSGT